MYIYLYISEFCSSMICQNTHMCKVFCYINHILALSVILCNEFEIVQEVQYGPR